MVINNEYTKKQIRDWLERSIAEAKNPDPVKLAKSELREKRMKKRKKVANNNGL